MEEFITKIEGLIAQYNEEFRKEGAKVEDLDKIEAELKEECAKARTAKTNEIYNKLAKEEDPMLEAIRMLSFSVPSYKETKVEGVKTGLERADRVVTINPVDFTDYLCKYQKGPKGGMSWVYKTEKLGSLLAYRALKDLGGSAKALKELTDNYYIREAARREDLGETPDSNSQLVKLMQTIIDAMVFVPDEKGKNQVKARSCDANFLIRVYTSAGREVGTVKVLKGARIAQYIFNCCHMIVTGKPYRITDYKKNKKGEGFEPVRKPVEGPAKKAKSTEDSASKKVKVPAPKKAKAPKAEEVAAPAETVAA